MHRCNSPARRQLGTASTYRIAVARCRRRVHTRRVSDRNLASRSCGVGSSTDRGDLDKQSVRVRCAAPRGPLIRPDSRCSWIPADPAALSSESTIPTSHKNPLYAIRRSALVEGPLPAATKTLSMPANLWLSVNRHVTSVGQTIYLSGTVSGSILSGGKAIAIQARALGGPWVQFDTATADSEGHSYAIHASSTMARKLQIPGRM